MSITSWVNGRIKEELTHVNQRVHITISIQVIRVLIGWNELWNTRLESLKNTQLSFPRSWFLFHSSCLLPVKAISVYIFTAHKSPKISTSFTDSAIWPRNLPPSVSNHFDLPLVPTMWPLSARNATWSPYANKLEFDLLPSSSPEPQILSRPFVLLLSPLPPQNLLRTCSPMCALSSSSCRSGFVGYVCVTISLLPSS